LALPKFTLLKNMALTFQLNNFLLSFLYNFFFNFSFFFSCAQHSIPFYHSCTTKQHGTTKDNKLCNASKEAKT
jgi:hypothetical protein